MKLDYLPLLALSLGLGISAANAGDGDRSFGDGELPGFLKQFDTNGDDVLDEEERQA
ncbi:MAG: hypothetical protein GWO24_28180, partial [Akkermansiaceae bacterium]|nr:hypothetical protein [Akkermansiaceae bacterium]